MKRDLDLVRDILLHIEAEFDPEEGVLQLSRDHMPENLTEEHSAAVVLRHVELLWDAGLVNVYLSKDRGDLQRSATGMPVIIAVGGLTHEGHEFLDEIRSSEVLKTTMERIGSAVGNASLAVIREVARGVTKELINERTP